MAIESSLIYRTKSMVIFHSYVNLPEGNYKEGIIHWNIHSWLIGNTHGL